MKRIIYLSVILPLFLFSCSSKKTNDRAPEAQFSTETINPEVGEVVYFINNSRYAASFEWDFGDGFISNETDPSHVFTGTGSFEVSLTAFSSNGQESKAFLTIQVMIPTLLEIQVLEYYDEYVVPDASVYLYPTLTDWDAQTNVTSEGFTDSNGTVVFSNLDPFVYYVDVYEATHDNYALRNEDVGFIRTPEILPHQINRFIAYVDIVNHGKGAARGARTMIIKKLERVSSDKKQPSPYAGTLGWQEMYKRRVVAK